jgi:hypothetical protein
MKPNPKSVFLFRIAGPTALLNVRQMLQTTMSSAGVFSAVAFSLVVVACVLAGPVSAQESGSQDDREQQSTEQDQNKQDSDKQDDDKQAKDQPEWLELFDGKQLGKWESTSFGGQGDVEIVDGELVLNAGEPLTGVTWKDGENLPTSNYEIELEAKRTLGIDFFCGLTFPVKKDHCSFIVAGWAGSIVGLSCLDGFDASENSTRQLLKFENDKWYKIRVRVTDDDIYCWIDDKRVVKQYLEGKKISVRNEVLDSRPLGVAAYQSTAHLRNIRLRKLSEKEMK